MRHCVILFLHIVGGECLPHSEKFEDCKFLVEKLRNRKSIKNNRKRIFRGGGRMFILKSKLENIMS